MKWFAVDLGLVLIGVLLGFVVGRGLPGRVVTAPTPAAAPPPAEAPSVPNRADSAPSSAVTIEEVAAMSRGEVVLRMSDVAKARISARQTDDKVASRRLEAEWDLLKGRLSAARR